MPIKAITKKQLPTEKRHFIAAPRWGRSKEMENCQICGSGNIKNTLGGYKCGNCQAEYVCTHHGTQLIETTRTERITFSKTSLKKHDAKIRAEAKAEALRDAADRAVEWWLHGNHHDRDSLRAAITQEPAE
jgi:transposase-like protein